MNWEAEITLTVPFHDVDPMGVVWHGHYYKYFEHARTALLQSFSYDYPDMLESGYLWPVIESQCRYVKPLTYGMEIRVIASLQEYQNRLKIGYLIQDAETRIRLARGSTTQVAVRAESYEMLLASPRVLLERLGVGE